MLEDGRGNLFEFPNLEVYFHGGVNFEPYREQYKKKYPQRDFKHEIYNASEGFFCHPDLNSSNELLMLDYGIFYEFIPMDTFGTMDQKTIRLADVELCKNYACSLHQFRTVALFNCTRAFHLIESFHWVTGRTKHHINVFGEELMVENTDQAIAKACKITDSEIVDYTAPILWIDRKKAHMNG
jgi:hypothetical protein